MKHFFLQHYRILCLGGALLCAAILPWVDGPFAKIALPIEDGKIHLREQLGMAPSPPAETVIVTVDEPSVNRLGRWPWDREIIGVLLSRLEQARIVGLDIVFSEPSNPAADQALADSIAEAGNIILGFFFRSDTAAEGTAEDLEQLAACAYREVRLLDGTAGVREFPFAEVNLPVFAEAAAGCAFFNTEPDADGLYRRYPLVYLHRGHPFPSLGVQLQRFSLNQEGELSLSRRGVAEFRLGGVRLQDTSYLRLNYYRNSPEVYVSAADIVEGKIAPDFFRDRLVLVGVTEMGIFDLRPTPVGAVTPGVLLHLTALGNLLQNDVLVDSYAGDLLLAACILLCVALVSRHPALRRRLCLYLPLLLAIFAISQLFFTFGNIWLHEFRTLLPVVGLTLTLEGIAFLTTERRAGELKRAFASYVSPEVVQEIINHPERLGLGGMEREVTTIFSDIRGFTSLSEQLTPTQLVGMLTDIHDPLTRIVLRHKGMLDKYIGDAMMALFNTPTDLPDHPQRAVEAALEMVQALKEINAGFAARGLPAVDIGIGINTGNCVVGNIGSRERFEYTAIGDSVNLASRLESLCKLYGCRIITSEFTVRRLETGSLLLRTLDRVRVKGKNQPVTIYEVMEGTDRQQTIRQHFETGWDLYLAGDFSTAGATFTRLVRDFADAPASLFAERCKLLLQQPPNAPWDGVHTLQTK